MVEWYGQEKTPDSSVKSLWQSYQQNRLIANKNNLEKEMMTVAFKTYLFILRSDFLRAVITYDMGPTALLPLRRKTRCKFCGS
jgi:hypothetical protein